MGDRAAQGAVQGEAVAPRIALQVPRVPPAADDRQRIGLGAAGADDRAILCLT